MFEDLLNQLYGERGVRLTDQAIVYLSYGCVHAMHYAVNLAKEQTKEVTRETVQSILSQEISDLKDRGIDVWTAPVRPELYPLVQVVAKHFDVNVKEDAGQFISQVIISASHIVLLAAADMVTEAKPDLMYVGPMELYAVCTGIFRNKPWFLC